MRNSFALDELIATIHKEIIIDAPPEHVWTGCATSGPCIYAATGGSATHHDASLQVPPRYAKRSRNARYYFIAITYATN